ncbi:hypothetical protein LAZ67_5002603 [Cordylochernes scorpioides]|uniref:DUF5641 domain-containing protein n=1 Tax=Cordylochernes scorpioides TaxID=51811 RepID=A0ABY6KJG6_9ARAC|nr:hypothetical protein LAZ67_5002603 [Cordylochernes scorpioides]
MSTILCDVEATINSRLLTYIHEDLDSLISLSPSRFLHESKDILISWTQRNFKIVIGIAKGCERLSEKANDRTPKLSVGDVVIVKVEDKRRLHWPMTRIMELFPGKDGHSRVAKVGTKLGTITHPVQKLYPLDVSSWDLILRSKGDTTIEEEHSEAKRTLCGRVVKPPQRLNLLGLTPFIGQAARKHDPIEQHVVAVGVDVRLIDRCDKFLEGSERYLDLGPLEITNRDRAFGTTLSYHLARKFGDEGLPEGRSIRIRLKGAAGQSLGAFLARGVAVELEGEANDYVGKVGVSMR